MYRKYFVYIDDGTEVYKVAITAVCEEAARASCVGNGEIIAIKDVTEQFPISLGEVRKALQNSGAFNGYELDFICRTLKEFEVAD